MKSSPPKLLSDANEKRPHSSRKINPPYDRLPSGTQQLQLWAWSLPPKVEQGEDYLPEEMKELYQRSLSTAHPLGDRPLITIVGMREDTPPPGMPQEQWDALHREKVDQKRAFQDLSTNSKVVEDKVAGHAVQLDDPDTVVTAIHDVLNAAQGHTSLSH